MKKQHVIYVAVLALFIASVIVFTSQINSGNAQSDCIKPPSDLVSWWPGQGDARDILGNNQGTVNNGTLFTPGMVGLAFDLDGVDDYVSVPDNPSLNPVNALTVDAWIKPNSPNNSSTPVVVKKGIMDDSGYSLEGGNGEIGFWVNITGRGWVSSPSANIDPDQWVHVAGVYDGSGISFYLNGSLIGTPTPAQGGIAVAGSELDIGHDPAVVERFFGGLIDEVHVFDRALSSSEIQAIYAAGSAGQCQANAWKTADKTHVTPGSPVNYGIRFNNPSTTTMESILITDTLPLALTYNEGSLRASGGSYTYQNGVITWTGSISATHVMTLTYGATVSSSATIGAPILNMATINAGGEIFTSTAAVNVDFFHTYLPVIAMVIPPPQAPVLSPISNPDKDGNYTVSWNAPSSANRYVLEEDDNPGFTSATLRYDGPLTSWDATNQTDGTYYYHVRAFNDYGSSFWSSAQSVLVNTCLPLYTDDFSNPASGWPVGNSSTTTVGYLNGEYRILVKPANYIVFVYDDFGASDYRVEVDARPGGSLNGGLGLIFGRTDQGFYLFEIHDGWFILLRNDPSWTWTVLIDWTPSSAIHTGSQTNHLKVVRYGASIQLYANGQLLATTSDATYLGSGLGISSDAFSKNYDGRFDNLVVQPGICSSGALNSMFQSRWGYFQMEEHDKP
jgi:uncharacterized repeat protein (TIGR01451 family)